MMESLDLNESMNCTSGAIWCLKNTECCKVIFCACTIFSLKKILHNTLWHQWHWKILYQHYLPMDAQSIRQ